MMKKEWDDYDDWDDGEIGDEEEFNDWWGSFKQLRKKF